MKTKQQNINFKVGDKVTCTFGINKGVDFIVKAVLRDGYSCKIADGSNDKYYAYDDSTLELTTK